MIYLKLCMVIVMLLFVFNGECINEKLDCEDDIFKEYLL